MRNGTTRALLFTLPSILFLVLFQPSLDYGFVWTDQGEIEHEGLMLGERPILSALWQPMHARLAEAVPGAAQPYYRPLQVIAINGVDRVFGREPRYFRALSFVFGAATTCLFTWLAWVLCRNRTAALLAGAITAVHPVLIEVHVWIAGLANTLVGTFAVASWLLASLAFREDRSFRAHAFAMGSFAALVPALLSKENAVAIPVGVLVLALAHLAPATTSRNGAPTLVPHRGPHLLACVGWLVPTQLGLAALYGAVWRPWVLGGVFAGAPPIGGDYGVHLATSIATWPDRIGWLLLPLASTSSDVVRLAAPADLQVWIGLLVLMGSIFFAWVLVRERQPVAALAIAWVWIGFAPSTGIIPLTHVRAERYLHLSLFGIALLPVALAWLPEGSRSTRRWIAVGLGILAVLGLFERTRARLPDWRSDETLFARDFGRDPLYREGAFMLARARRGRQPGERAGDPGRADRSLARVQGSRELPARS